MRSNLELQATRSARLACGSLLGTKLAGAPKRDAPRSARLPDSSNECGHVFRISNPRKFLLEFTRSDGGLDCLASTPSPVQRPCEHLVTPASENASAIPSGVTPPVGG